MANILHSDLIEKIKSLKLLILDVDGVLTDGSLFYGENGEAIKRFNVLDGMGIVRIIKAGMQVAIISGRDSKIVSKRATDLGIQHVFQGISDKVSTYQLLLNKLSIDHQAVAFIGDDVIDLDVLNKVGLSICPPGAVESVKNMAMYCTHTKGGEGAVREICDLIIEHNNHNETC